MALLVAKFRSRKNGANGAQLIDINNGLTGEFSDAVNSDTFVPGDLVDLLSDTNQLATSGTITYQYAALLIENTDPPPVTFKPRVMVISVALAAMLLLAACQSPPRVPPPVVCPPVVVCPRTKPCLADRDARWFAACTTGPTYEVESVMLTPANTYVLAHGRLRRQVYWETCNDLDADRDGDVDLLDYSLFQQSAR